MKGIIEKLKCNGCQACYNVCMKNAIVMKEDENGFLYPLIDNKNCVDCGLCKSVCPILQSDTKLPSNVQAYAVKNLDEAVKSNSSSGGVFHSLATYVLNNNGVVFGVVLDSNLTAKHIKITTTDEIYKLQGSKYLQSDVQKTYQMVKEELSSGKLVLFTGTPCQNAGLASFLRKDYDNLILQDIICHGVPSPLAFKKYIEEIEKEHKNTVKHVFFRSKKSGWKEYSVEVVFNDNSSFIEPSKDNLFIYGLVSNLTLRSSCFNCNFKGDNRCSDITLADFWGIENALPEFDDDKGVSLVLINSKKGEQVFDRIKDGLQVLPVDFDLAVANNKSYGLSADNFDGRKIFFKKIKNSKFSIAIKNTKSVLRVKRLPKIIAKKLKKLFKLK
ncbi:MAG: 4Fe-4S dicluster domain-containing protein [Clostridiales bacterium]|nr:4Fe-4S dicluster domain-containing protein [Clostridiales bacterium]